MEKFRNRIKEVVTMRAGDIADNPQNWHIHPEYQNEAIAGLLEEYGKVGVLRAYHSERYGGLTFLDGHGRKDIEPNEEWTIVILDINDEEADDLLSLLNTTGKWGQIDAQKFAKLAEKNKSDNAKVKAALSRIKDQIAPQVELAARLNGEEGTRQPKRMVADYEEKMKASVKAVIPIEDGLEIVEDALKATDIRHRGKAFLEVCRFYLDHHGEPKDKNEAEAEEKKEKKK